MIKADPEEKQAASPERQGFMSKLRKHADIHIHIPLIGVSVHVKTWPALCVVLVLVLSTILIPTYLQYSAKHVSKLPAVAVFLPDWTRPLDHPFYQDGFVQKRGFDQAQRECEGNGAPRVEYVQMKLEATPGELLTEMKSHYSEGAVFFVMTMSSKIKPLLPGFRAWRNEVLKEGGRPPVLVATVASAPDLADANNGVVRWYIRSEEESELVAEFLRWRRAVGHAAVFYITRTPGVSDDSYGQRGMEVFRERFLALGGEVETHGVTADTAADEVKNFVKNGPQPAAAGVFVVGYGKMVSATLNALIAAGFSGSIASTSTLTERDWQPTDQGADDRIFTVLPRLEKASLEGDDRNVVFYFARITLRRVLQMTVTDRDPAKFVTRWTSGQDASQLSEEYLANGDTLVRVEVVGKERWR